VAKKTRNVLKLQTGKEFSDSKRVPQAVGSTVSVHDIMYTPKPRCP